MFIHSLGEDRWLRLFEEADLDELHAAVEANREMLARWMPWAVAPTRDRTLEFIRSSLRQFAENAGFQVAIIERGAIVGGTGFARPAWANRSGSIGYWLARSAQGRGTVTLAARALVDHAFGAWKLNRV